MNTVDYASRDSQLSQVSRVHFLGFLALDQMELGQALAVLVALGPMEQMVKVGSLDCLGWGLGVQALVSEEVFLNNKGPRYMFDWLGAYFGPVHFFF